MFSIGEFARLGSVSVRMLRHYDELGLLRPDRVDPETGYRSYRASQLSRLNRIVALKDLGFGLQEVGQLLDQLTAEQLQSMLLLRRSQLEGELAANGERLTRVGARLAAIEQEENMPDDVVIKSLPEQRVAAVGHSAPGFGPDNLAPVLRRAGRELQSALRASAISASGPELSFYAGDQDEGTLVAYTAVPVDADVEEIERPAEIFVLPPIEAATVVREGSITDIWPAVYADLARWLEQQGLEHVGPGRDVLIEWDPESARGVAEIQWPIQRPDSPTPDVAPRRLADSTA